MATFLTASQAAWTRRIILLCCKGTSWGSTLVVPASITSVADIQARKQGADIWIEE